MANSDIFCLSNFIITPRVLYGHLITLHNEFVLARHGDWGEVMPTNHTHRLVTPPEPMCSSPYHPTPTRYLCGSIPFVDLRDRLAERLAHRCPHAQLAPSVPMLASMLHSSCHFWSRLCFVVDIGGMAEGGCDVWRER